MSCGLETFVGKVKSHIIAKNYNELANHLKEYNDMLIKNWNILDAFIDSLDLQQNTIGVVYMLAAKFECATTSNTDMMQLSNMLQDFLDNCNEDDLQCALNPFYELCHNFTKFIIDKPNNISCINLLVDAIEKVRQEAQEPRLTPIHSDLCQLCLKAHHYEAALKYLNIDIIDISTSTETQPKDKEKEKPVDTNYDAKYCLQYFYYGGMIYTAIKEYERALYFYELCLSVPASALSHIMLEAYKKFILLSLILRGRLVPLAKQSTNIHTRVMKPEAQVYLDLVTAYSNHNSEQLIAVVNKNIETYYRDNNCGLVNQMIESLYKYNIQLLRQTFLTLSLEDVAEKVQLPSAALAEWFVYNMIKTGEIYASINRIDGMVVFHDCDERFNTVNRYIDVQQMMTEAADWIKQLNIMEEKIALDQGYIKKILAMSGGQDDDTGSTKSFNAEQTD